MATENNDVEEAITVRMPLLLSKTIGNLAKTDRRSKNSEIVVLLEMASKQKKGGRAFKVTYQRADLKDNVEYAITYFSEKAESPEQALIELRHNVQGPHYAAISHATHLKVEQLSS